MATKQSPKTEKIRKDRSAPIYQDAFEILEAASKHGYKKIRFASEAIIAYARKTLPSDAIPASPEEALADRLECLERFIIAPKWKKLAESDATLVLAADLTSMIKALRFEPHAVNLKSLKKANAWRKKHGIVTGNPKDFNLDHIILAAYAYKLGLLPEKDAPRVKKVYKPGVQVKLVKSSAKVNKPDEDDDD